MEEIVPIPSSSIKTIKCDTCNTTSHIYTVKEAGPHLYCTKCNNVYHEKYSDQDHAKIRTKWGRRKSMSIIESQAPICECRGLFLFNSHPNCKNCGCDLPIIEHEPDSRERFLYSDLVVFDGTVEYLNQGHKRIYRFEQ
ncbi:MAG: hypothetical protein Q8P90_00725 [bacterium]|nr:hypothetical protein [bacterium]